MPRTTSVTPTEEVTWAEVLAEASSEMARIARESGEVVDGRPRFDSWAVEAGDPEMFELIREIAHGLGVPLSARLIRRARQGILEHFRENQRVDFAAIDCSSCGERFFPNAPRTTDAPRYCSNVCRQRAYRARVVRREAR